LAYWYRNFARGSRVQFKEPWRPSEAQGDSPMLKTMMPRLLTVILAAFVMLGAAPRGRTQDPPPDPNQSQDQNQPQPQPQGQSQPQYPNQDLPQDQNQSQDPNQPQDQNQNPNVGQDAGGNYQSYTADQLDNLLSPIALYPDPLLAQVLVAATFPDQVEEAARYVRSSGQNGIDDQTWDVSVKAVAHYPTVIGMMADKVDWTTSLGQAYVNQSTDVSTAVQRLRHMARKVGNLQTSPQQEVLENGEYIAITPLQPQYLYVPIYDPLICYYRRPYWGPAISFGLGYPIGGWLNLDFRWGFGGGFGGVFYTGWRPWGGWNGGWLVRSRPFIRGNNFYINNRYSNIQVNRAVINRSVNVNNISRYNSIHRNVTYNNVQANNARVNRVNDVRVNNVQNNRTNINNRTLNRNINTNNSRVNDFRGRDNAVNRPGGQPNGNFQNRGANNSFNRPAQQTAPHTFGRSEGNFDSRASSQRGQQSREQMSRPAGREESRGGGGGGSRGESRGGGRRP
jgi:Protein of unknown function (DUF3300)